MYSCVVAPFIALQPSEKWKHSVLFINIEPCYFCWAWYRGKAFLNVVAIVFIHTQIPISLEPDQLNEVGIVILSQSSSLFLL